MEEYMRSCRSWKVAWSSG